MPLCNRVAPTGELLAVAARGLLMGNRGRLHDDAGRLTRRRWTTHAWVCCVLEFKGRWRAPMPPGRWTALFFLDEATALAAGHRPCGECRRADYRRYREAGGSADRPLAALDAALHADRTARTRPTADPRALPDGAMVALDGASWLVLGGALRRWTPDGYADRRAVPAIAALLTPAPSLAALAGGFRPLLHPSALA